VSQQSVQSVQEVAEAAALLLAVPLLVVTGSVAVPVRRRVRGVVVMRVPVRVTLALAGSLAVVPARLAV
jgi:hypothetical protein